MIVELLSITAVFLGGCAALRTLGVRGWALPALGLLAGISLQLAVGLVQVVTPLPTSPALTLALTFGAPAAWWVLRWRRGEDVTVSLRHGLLVLAGLAVAVAALRVANLAKWHTDSFTYLMAGSLLAEGNYVSDVATRLFVKRTLGVPLLHAPANLGGDYYLRSIHALLAVAVLVAVIWLFRRGAARLTSPAMLLVLTGLGAALLVTGNRFVFSMFYLNGHLLTAALLLLIAGSGWLLATRHQLPADAPAAALLALQLLAIPALVVTRPEGPLLAAVALLPTWLSTRTPVPHRIATMSVLGAANVMWQGLGVWLHLQRGVEIPASIGGALVFGVLLLLAAPLLRRQPRRRTSRYLLWSAEAGVWLALLAFTVRRPGVLVDSVNATVQNLVFGAGRWGLTLVALLIPVVLAMLLIRAPGLVHLRFPLTTFLPLSMLLAFLRDAPYRVGYGDSLSRMFMHVVPLAVLFLLAAMAARSAAAGPAAPDEPGATRTAEPDPERPVLAAGPEPSGGAAEPDRDATGADVPVPPDRTPVPAPAQATRQPVPVPVPDRPGPDSDGGGTATQ